MPGVWGEEGCTVRGLGAGFLQPGKKAGGQRTATNHRGPQSSLTAGMEEKFIRGSPPLSYVLKIPLWPNEEVMLHTQRGPLGLRREGIAAHCLRSIIKFYDTQSLAEASGKCWNPPFA